jgi:hypothetical protein
LDSLEQAAAAATSPGVRAAAEVYYLEVLLEAS